MSSKRNHAVSQSGYILKVEPTGIADRWDVRRGREGSDSFLAHGTRKPAVSFAGVGDSVGKGGFGGKTDFADWDLW